MTAELLANWLRETMYDKRVKGVDIVKAFADAGKPMTPGYVANMRHRGMSIYKAMEVADVMGWDMPLGMELGEKPKPQPEPQPPTNPTTSITISSLTPVAGHSHANNDGEILEKIQVPTAWIKAAYPQTQTSALALCAIGGDSMEPSFKPQDTVLIDTTTCTFDQDGLYIFTYHDTLLIKRIQRRPGLGFIVISDNKEFYESYEIPTGDLENLEVHGKVIGKFRFDKF